MIEGPYTRSLPSPWTMVFIVALGINALAIVMSQAADLMADSTWTSPSVALPEPQNEPGSDLPDPCGLIAVECPQEVTSARVEPQDYDRVIHATVYTYQAEPDQTDADPCTTASGFDACGYWEGKPAIVANNCLEFGTEVVIRHYVYEVQDRMDDRYGCDVFDILIGGETTPWTWHNEPVYVL